MTIGIADVKGDPSMSATVELLISSGCPSLHHLIAFKATRRPNAALLTGLGEANTVWESLIGQLADERRAKVGITAAFSCVSTGQ